MKSSAFLPILGCNTPADRPPPLQFPYARNIVVVDPNLPSPLAWTTFVIFLSCMISSFSPITRAGFVLLGSEREACPIDKAVSYVRP